MKKLILTALLMKGIMSYGQETQQVDLADMLYFYSTQYSQEFPIDVLVVGYDTKKDGKENERAIYQFIQMPDGQYATRLIEVDKDLNNTGFYEDADRFIVVDLVKEHFDRFMKSKRIKQKNNNI